MRLRWHYALLLIAALTVIAAAAYVSGCDSSDDNGAGGDETAGPDNAEPTAVFTVTPTSGTTATNFIFNATASWDPETVSEALQVRWDWDGDGTYDTAFTTAKTAAHRFTTAGSYRVTVQVRDSYGATGTASRTVAVAAP